jgi:poly[(R)-3-hydroxyalkanoate] polymerase subunit PhaC
MTTPTSRRTRRAGEAVRSGLDVMLTDAAAGTPRFFAPGPAVKVAAGLARHPTGVARRAAGLGTELRRAATGRSQLAPANGDRRFADPAWQENWLLRDLLQAYLALGETVDGLISDAGVDWRTERQARLAAGNVIDALAPTNFPWSNPAVLREIVNTGGTSLARGLRRMARDVSSARLPSTVDTSRFEVGENLAVTPGSVVLRNEVLELIHYRPTTKQVRETPLLLVPPTINKYYILDLAPGRSLVEYLLGQGQQVFAISWRNPDQDQGHFDLDTYAQAIADAREAASAISGQDAVHVAAACSGGIVASGLVGHLAATGRLGEIASLTLMVCALDNAQAGTVSALASRDLAAAAVAESARKGYLDGQALAGVFTWLRPNDLVWSYVVNNYLLGKEPPAFDILYWNQDTVRMSAGLHRDFIHIGLENSFTQPGGLELLGTPVDMSAVDLDVYAIAGLSDHIVPWENAYRSAQLFGGQKRFVLSRSGHIQALVNPPSTEGAPSRASYRVADDLTADAETFLEQTPKQPGSWWPDWDAWLAERSGGLRAAPTSLGNRRFRAQAKAPGSYVLAN